MIKYMALISSVCVLVIAFFGYRELFFIVLCVILAIDLLYVKLRMDQKRLYRLFAPFRFYIRIQNIESLGEDTIEKTVKIIIKYFPHLRASAFSKMINKNLIVLPGTEEQLEYLIAELKAENISIVQLKRKGH